MNSTNITPTFNLLDEPWIPIVASNPVTLREIFSNPSLPALGGTPIQKMALHKLFQAIAQAAWTPQNEQEWRSGGVPQMVAACATYLDKWHDRFFLYGPQPFLQMPAIGAAAKVAYSAVIPHIASGNATVLTHQQRAQPLDDGQKALLLVQLMAFALGGKKTDNSIVLSKGYAGKSNDKGKPSTGKAGPSMSHFGLLHTMLMGTSLQETIWMNLFDAQQLAANTSFASGLGTAPWEQMPAGEACPVAKSLQSSLMGRLVPLSRFVLFATDGLHYSEGIQHQDYSSGMLDPSVSVDVTGKKPRVLWVHPDKRPWRELTSLMSFLAQQQSKGFDCWQLRTAIPRLAGSVDRFAVWSGGLRVSSNAGEQYVSGGDDIVESHIWLESAVLNETWFMTLRQEMDWLEAQSKKLYSCTNKYFTIVNGDADTMAARATALFWRESETAFGDIATYCGSEDSDEKARQSKRKAIALIMNKVYNAACPNTTARQMIAWAECRPH